MGAAGKYSCASDHNGRTLPISTRNHTEDALLLRNSQIGLEADQIIKISGDIILP